MNADERLRKEMEKLKAQGITISFTPARGSDGTSVGSVLYEAAKEAGVAEAPELSPAEAARSATFFDEDGEDG